MFENIPPHIRKVFFKCFLENEVDYINFPCFITSDYYQISVNSKEEFLLIRNNIKRKIKLDKLEKL